MTREFVYLTRFDRRENEKPIRDTIIDEYRAFFRSRVGGLDEYRDYPLTRIASRDGYEIREAKDEWPPLSFAMPGKSVMDIWPALIEMSFEDWMEETADLAFGLAQLGGLCVWLPKVILIIDETQKGQLPVSWSGNRTRKVMDCRNAMFLFDSVKQYQLDIPIQDRDYGFAPYDQPIEGTYPNRARSIYIEALQKETAVQHQRIFHKHHTTKNPADRPQSGLVMSTFWEVTTPDNVRFYSYAYGGPGWFDYLRDFAMSNRRKYGVVVNYDTFVSDNMVVPVTECRVALDKRR